MALDGDISHDEYSEIKARNESEIRAWESQTHTAQEREIALKLVAQKIDNIYQQWVDGDNIQQQKIADTFFEYIVYDLDKEAIVMFALQEWVHLYYEVVSSLYNEGYLVYDPSSFVAICDPSGTRTRVSTLKGWCPRPLDDGAVSFTTRISLAAPPPHVKTESLAIDRILIHP